MKLNETSVSFIWFNGTQYIGIMFKKTELRTFTCFLLSLVIVLACTCNSILFSVSSPTYGRVLVVKDVDPFGVNSNEIVLSKLGVEYDIVNSTELDSVNLAEYRVVIIASGQYNYSYTNLVKFRELIANYVEDGGVLVAHCCDYVRSTSGVWDESFIPKNISHVRKPINSLLIADPTSPITRDLTNNDLSGWFYSAHGYFVDFPDDTYMIVTTSGGNPTYIEYAFGFGIVLATTQTIEYPWKRCSQYPPICSGKKLLENEIKYALSLTVPAIIDFDPDTFNLKVCENCTYGEWVTVYIELPNGYDVRNIELDSIKLITLWGSVSPEKNPKYGFVSNEESYIVDHDHDGVLERMVKFNRTEVAGILRVGDSVSVVVRGKVIYNGESLNFVGVDIIRVIDSCSG